MFKERKKEERKIKQKKGRKKKKGRKGNNCIARNANR